MDKKDKKKILEEPLVVKQEQGNKYNKYSCRQSNENENETCCKVIDTEEDVNGGSLRRKSIKSKKKNKKSKRKTRKSKKNRTRTNKRKSKRRTNRKNKRRN